MSALALGLIACVCAAASFAITAYSIRDRWRTPVRVFRLLTKPSTIALYALTLLAIALFASVFALIEAQDLSSQARASSTAILGAAAVAAFGWIYTSFQSRRLAVTNHTQDLLGQHRTSDIYEAHRRNIMRRFPVGERLNKADVDEILAQRKSREHHWSDAPPLYYSIQQTLNFHEYIASGIKNDRLDEAIVEQYQKAILVGATQKFLPLIKCFRQESSNSYSDLKWIIQYWYSVDIDDDDSAAKLADAVRKERAKKRTQQRSGTG